MIEIALVGCAHIHTPGFVKRIKERSDVHVKCVWDADRRRSDVWAAELGAPVVENPKKIWKDKEIRAAIICSQTDQHQKLVLAGAKAQKHLFVEKPLGMGSKDGYKMAAAIEKAGVLFQTGYFMRGSPIHLFLREQIRQGLFGKITRVRASNCHAGALGGWFDAKGDDVGHDWRWMADPSISGVGAFGDLGTHSLDILLWLIGDVTSATASVNTGTNRYEGCDETGEGLMTFANGTIGTLAAAWNDVANPVSLIISGTEAHAAIINGKLHLTTKKLEGADGKEPWTQLPAAVPAGLDSFLDAIAGRSDAALVRATEAAYRSAVMEAMYEGARKGKWIAPKAPSATAPAQPASPATPATPAAEPMEEPAKQHGDAMA